MFELSSLVAFVRGHFRRTSSGVTYVQPHRRRGASASATKGGGELLAIVSLAALVVLAAGIIWIVKVIAAHLLAIAIVVCIFLGSLGAGFGIVATVRGIRRRRVEEYLERCRAFVLAGGRLSGEPQALEYLAKRIPASDQVRSIGEETLYRDTAAAILADLHVDEDERRLLAALERLFSLDERRTREIKESAFVALLPALKGAFFGAEEECNTRSVAAGLGLGDEFVNERLAPLIDERERLTNLEILNARRQAEAERAEQIRQAALEDEYRLVSLVLESGSRQPLETALATRLGKKEFAWYESPAVQVRHLKRGDERTTGVLVVTNQRILFVSKGVVSLSLSKILDASADRERGILRLVKDGRKEPFDFEMQQPLLAMAHIERSLRDA